MLLLATCILQPIIGSMIDRRYDEKLLMYFLDTIWYPVAFWLISMITTVVALPASCCGAEASGPYGSAPTEAFNMMKNAPIIDLSCAHRAN